MKKLPTFESGNQGSTPQDPHSPSQSPSSPQTYMPSEIPPKKSLKKRITLVVVAIAAVKFLAKIALGLGIGFGTAEAEVEASKQLAWDAKFKSSFVTSCSEGKPAVVGQFCACMADKIEAAHVLPTKYNSIRTSEEEYGNQIGETLGQFLGTPQGEEIKNGCLKVAGIAPTNKADDTAEDVAESQNQNTQTE